MPILNGTQSANGPVIELFVGLSIHRYTALQQANVQAPPPIFARALIDTGASCTAVDPMVIQRLALPATGTAAVHTPSTGGNPHTCNQYDVSLWLPSAQNIKFTIPVIESRLAALGLDVLLGRDVLDDCLLVYNGPTRTFSLALE
jgi:predicted aspartyl protease